jgi:hypothetical protein
MTKSFTRTALALTGVDTLVLAGCSSSSSSIVASVMGPDDKDGEGDGVAIGSSTLTENADVDAPRLLRGVGECSLSGRLSGGADRG